MKYLVSTQEVDIPEDVTVKVKARVVEVKGPRGTIKRSFKHMTADMKVVKTADGKKKFVIEKWFASYKLKSAVTTISSHVYNMVVGVTRGHRYKMRMVFAHFPITINISNGGKTIEIRNFIGEKHVKKIDLFPGCIVKKSETPKDQLELEGIDLENVSLSCALISQCIRVKGKDIRKFLDGIYVSAKEHLDDE